MQMPLLKVLQFGSNDDDEEDDDEELGVNEDEDEDVNDDDEGADDDELKVVVVVVEENIVRVLLAPLPNALELLEFNTNVLDEDGANEIEDASNPPMEVLFEELDDPELLDCCELEDEDVDEPEFEPEPLINVMPELEPEFELDPVPELEDPIFVLELIPVVELELELWPDVPIPELIPNPEIPEPDIPDGSKIAPPPVVVVVVVVVIVVTVVTVTV